MKSSNNNEYRVKPVYGFIEGGKNVEIEVLRLEGPAKVREWEKEGRDYEIRNMKRLSCTLTVTQLGLGLLMLMKDIQQADASKHDMLY